MTWNYRVVKYLDGSGYGLHEVYYDKENKPWAMTTDPIPFSTDSDEGPETVIKALKMALKDAEKYPVFEEPEKWPGKAP